MPAWTGLVFEINSVLSWEIGLQNAGGFHGERRAGVMFVVTSDGGREEFHSVIYHVGIYMTMLACGN